MEIFLLDVGSTKYGDCIVLHKGSRWILIDAAHPGDTNLISTQLEQLFGHAAPFNFNLLVVTHCHLDHIGCLPELVASGTVTCAQALVADEKFGWGRDLNDLSPIDDASGNARTLAVALQEEPVDDASDEEIRQFLEDAATLESKYKTMLTTLQTSGTQIIRFGRDPDSQVAALETAFADFGMKVLGPTQDHLLRCAQYIFESTHDAVDALKSDAAVDAPGGLVDAYRRGVKAAAARVVEDFEGAPLEDRAGVGAAKNDQSIVLKFADQGKTVLLAGDMQFAQAEVPDLDADMTALRGVVQANGPYDFIKLTHHTSYNGFDVDVWNEWLTPSDTYLFAHTGGRNDSGHPDRGVLTLLREYRDQLQFARTDRNGMITVKLKATGVEMSVARGQINNFARNTVPDVTPPSGTGPTVVEREVVVQAGTQGTIEITAKLPPNATKFSLTVDLDPEKKN